MANPTIPRELVRKYNQALNIIVSAAGDKFDNHMSVYRTGNIGIDAVRELIYNDIVEIVRSYGLTARLVSNEFYNTVRILQMGEGIELTTELTNFDLYKLRRAFKYAYRHVYDGQVDEFIGYMRGVLDKEIKQIARDSTISAAERDNLQPRFARVPIGKTCAWCIAIASQGFIYRSAASAGEFTEYHKFCDCQVVPNWEVSPRVEGFDPDALYDIYKQARDEAGSTDLHEVTKYMRRQHPDLFLDGVIDFDNNS